MRWLICAGGRLIDEVLKFFERMLYLPKPLEVREREKKE